MEQEINTILEVTSFNDIITNSSTEIYSAESNKNLKKTLKEVGIEYFEPVLFNDILDLLEGKTKHSHDFIFDVMLGINHEIKEHYDKTHESGWGDRMPVINEKILNFLKNKWGLENREIARVFAPIYMPIYGKIYITLEQWDSLGRKFLPNHPRTASKFDFIMLD